MFKETIFWILARLKISLDYLRAGVATKQMQSAYKIVMSFELKVMSKKFFAMGHERSFYELSSLLNPYPLILNPLKVLAVFINNSA